MTMTVQDAVTLTVQLQLALRRETRQDIAQVLGITPSAVTARFKGRTRWSVDDLDRLSEHFGVSVARIVEPPVAALAGSGVLESAWGVDGMGAGREAVSKRERRTPEAGGTVLVMPRRRVTVLPVTAVA